MGFWETFHRCTHHHHPTVQPCTSTQRTRWQWQLREAQRKYPPSRPRAHVNWDGSVSKSVRHEKPDILNERKRKFLLIHSDTTFWRLLTSITTMTSNSKVKGKAIGIDLGTTFSCALNFVVCVLCVHLNMKRCLALRASEGSHLCSVESESCVVLLFWSSDRRFCFRFRPFVLNPNRSAKKYFKNVLILFPVWQLFYFCFAHKQRKKKLSHIHTHTSSTRVCTF